MFFFIFPAKQITLENTIFMAAAVWKSFCSSIVLEHYSQRSIDYKTNLSATSGIALHVEQNYEQVKVLISILLYCFLI